MFSVSLILVELGRVCVEAFLVGKLTCVGNLEANHSWAIEESQHGFRGAYRLSEVACMHERPSTESRLYLD